ncbi:hypothetical protein ACFY00_05505 [Kitasatospora sp. NPDC001540]|uniref:hypothetical protein n=1 Tax=Kitasatospora sp. NPDC001540 TaxID=3364014 RepID=UPI0036C30567
MTARALLNTLITNTTTYDSSGNDFNWRYLNGSRPVTGAANPGVRSYVFVSGPWSGAPVLEVIAVNRCAVADGVTHGPGFWTVSEEGIASVGQGGSGGPAAGVNSDPRTVSARGPISVVLPNSHRDACAGRTHDGRVCSTRSFHINIDAVTAEVGSDPALGTVKVTVKDPEAAGQPGRGIAGTVT